MKKIPALFVRDHSTPAAPYSREVAPGCEWVIAGEGNASRKWDGTACAVIGGVLHARYDAKRGKVPPPDAVPCQDPDPVTGHWPHWVPVVSQPQFKYHRAAWQAKPADLPDGTYELIGPMVNANPDAWPALELRRHGDVPFVVPVRTFDTLLAMLTAHYIEGLVFAHPDGRMVKVTRQGFGLPWNSKKAGL